MATSISRAWSNSSNPLQPHIANKYDLVFVDEDRIKRYDDVVCGKFVASNYLDEQMLDTLH